MLRQSPSSALMRFVSSHTAQGSPRACTHVYENHFRNPSRTTIRSWGNISCSESSDIYQEEGMSHTVCTQEDFCCASPTESLALSAQQCPKHASYCSKDVALLPGKSIGHWGYNTYSHNKRHSGATLRSLCSPGRSYQLTPPLFLLQENIFNVK